MSATGGDPGLRALAAAAFRAHVRPVHSCSHATEGFHALGLEVDQ